ncbi:MAG: hypothetical protein M1817_000887 [Caeruleum heppii]|nr:MAG: hypothetical protein M1817_000887 [Caeruleum heppii]
MASSEDLLRRPLYVFDLPRQLLDTLQFKDDVPAREAESSQEERPPPPSSPKQDGSPEGSPAPTTSCAFCGLTLGNVKSQRDHVRSDLHGYNLKQKMRGLTTVTEVEFDKLVGDLDESISGSDSSTSDEDEETDNDRDSTLTALLKRQAKLSTPDANDGDFVTKKRKRGSGRPPMLWFKSSVLPTNTSLGVYRALLTDVEQADQSNVVKTIHDRQLSPKPPPILNPDGGVALPNTTTNPHIFLCMIGGGHFAGMIVSLAPKLSKRSTGGDERQATVLAHKTFHRYTTRRKQGGAQSANDASKGAAHSAGSSLRRYNETALIADIRGLLAEWKTRIDTAQLLFVRASGTTNRRTLFGPYDGQILRTNDARLRSFPFSTRRATQAELMRAFVELTRVKISEVDEAALAAAAVAAKDEANLKNIAPPNRPTPPPTQPKPSDAEIEALHHTTQLQALIRRSKAPALITYFTTHHLPPTYHFHPSSAQQYHHAPTPLHLAASINSPPPVLAALLTKLHLDPTLLNDDGKTAFELAGDRPTRDAFRVARHDLGDDRWDWEAARVPPGMSRAEADARAERDRKDAETKEAERRRGEVERLEEMEREAQRRNGEVREKKMGKGKVMGVIGMGAEKSAQEKREEEARGLTPEMRMKLERERRARAAEERIRRMGGGVGGGGAGR